MRSYRNQRGLSAISWLCVIVVVVFFGLCAFKMVPAYNENLMVKAALRSLANQPEGVGAMTKTEIRNELRQFYDMNNVRGEPTRSLKIEEHRGKTLVFINYEVRVPLFANISVVMTFNNMLDSSQPQNCCDPPAE
jgi:hypothetical protein